MDAHDEMIASQLGDEPRISPSELNAGLGAWTSASDPPKNTEWVFVRWGAVEEPDDGLENGCCSVAYYANGNWHGKPFLANNMIVSYWMPEPKAPNA